MTPVPAVTEHRLPTAWPHIGPRSWREGDSDVGWGLVPSVAFAPGAPVTGTGTRFVPAVPLSLGTAPSKQRACGWPPWPCTLD